MTGLFLFPEDFRADKLIKLLYIRYMSELVATCVKAGQWGFILHGYKVAVETMVSTDNNGPPVISRVAHLNFPFRDDIVEVTVPESEVQTPDMNCSNCKYRIQHMITSGECPGKYAPMV